MCIWHQFYSCWHLFFFWIPDWFYTPIVGASVYFCNSLIPVCICFFLNTRLVLYQHCKDQCVFGTSLIPVGIFFFWIPDWFYTSSVRSGVYFVPLKFLLAFVFLLNTRPVLYRHFKEECVFCSSLIPVRISFFLNTRVVLYQHCKEGCVFSTSLIPIMICFSSEYQTGSIPAL